ncbi:uncharacterized protein LOC131068777 isoform X9 [Cryptomeria japonica]|uniref:uncharacterized protein LOC131068777 isoform X9 n=1 Tax=Cryptomeria japonica TaxID=3369 RepID=UPI0027DA6BD7|nr:uncharacterized protein LOC131068777 isoform X9 [Cryptomeria japonica]
MLRLNERSFQGVWLSSMAYTPGRGRLAAMERLLSSGSSMEPSSAEEAIRERLAAQVIQKEMDEADEANLLEEEDMHVFEWKPLTDPLNLVSCKTCKKPIKASQYAAHAERCKSLSASDDTGLELDGGTGHKRPPRKVRKKVQTTHENQTTAAGDQEISESFDGEDTCASESANVDDCHMGIASSLSREVKKSPMLVDGSLIVDGSGSASYSEGAMSPSKRAKLLPVQSSLTSDNSDSMCGVTMESGTCCQGPLTYIPAPLATKIYYPRQNQRLRAVLGHLYQESLKKENSNEPSIPKPLSGDAGVQSGRVQILPPDNDVTDQQKDLMGQKKQKELSTISSIRKSEQMLPPTSEIGRSITNGHPSHMNFQNQYHENKFARSQLPMEVGPAGIMRNRFIQTPYTFTGNAGTSMGSMQQANGIVPVI